MRWQHLIAVAFLGALRDAEALAVQQLLSPRDASNGSGAAPHSFGSPSARPRRKEQPRLAMERWNRGHDAGGAFVFDMDTHCQPERRVEAAEHLRSTFERQGWASRIREHFARLGEASLLVVGEGRTRRLLRNFLLHAEEMTRNEGRHRTVTHVSLDQQGFEACEKARGSIAAGSGGLTVFCMSLAGWLPAEFFSETFATDGAMAGSCAYNYILWTKPHIFSAAVRASTGGVLLLDADVVLYRDLIARATELLANETEHVIVCAKERGKNRHVNTGAVFASTRSTGVLDLWLEKNDEYLNAQDGDQGALQAVFRRKKIDRLLAIFQNDIVGSCGIKGEWATHYNCYSAKAKRARMKVKGDWDRLADGKLGIVGQVRAVGGSDAGRDLWSGVQAPAEDVDATVEAIRDAGDWSPQGSPGPPP